MSEIDQNKISYSTTYEIKVQMCWNITANEKSKFLF